MDVFPSGNPAGRGPASVTPEALTGLEGEDMIVLCLMIHPPVYAPCGRATEHIQRIKHDPPTDLLRKLPGMWPRALSPALKSVNAPSHRRLPLVVLLFH